MAQTGFTPLQIYSSSTAAAAPTAGNLINSTLGSELAINITDGKLFYKDNANAVQVIGWKTVPTGAGGTGLTSYTAGDLLFYATGTALSKLTIGASGSYLSSTGSAPQWSAPAALTKTDDTNVTLTLGGSASTSLLNAASITVGWSGTLAASRGGTGLSALGTGVATWLGTPSSANLAAAVTDETGSGALVFGTSPTLTTPTIAQIRSASATEPPTLANSSGTEYGQTAKAWVNGDGDTGAIRTSFNCSSFSKTATGVYAMSFTNAVADANFAVVMSCGDSLVSNQTFMSRTGSTTTSVTVRTFRGSTLALTDTDPIYLAIFR
jgi:hypothetical protein